MTAFSSLGVKQMITFPVMYHKLALNYPDHDHGDHRKQFDYNGYDEVE